MKNRRPLNIEGLLRSIWGQAGLVLVLVSIVSLAMSVPRFEIAELRGREVDRTEIFLNEMLRWGLWAPAVWPITFLARWILTTAGSWTLFFLIQIPLSGACGWGFQHIDHYLRGTGVIQLGPRSGEDARGLERRGGAPGRGVMRPGLRGEDRLGDRAGRRRAQLHFGDGPDWESPFWRHRWMSTTLLYWVVLGMGVGLTTFLGMRDKERRAADLELRAERLRSELAHAQLGSLRNQINPHFLFNALHSVGGLVRAKDDQAALRTLAAIGELLRLTLDHGGAEEVLLHEELGIAERFLEIEKIRLGERLSVEFEVDQELRAARVPALMLLPLVENAVRHGIAPLPEGGCVVVSAKKLEGSVAIEVLDNGEGFPRDVIDRDGSRNENGRRSIGLENTRDRLIALYADDQTFELDNVEPRGARVRITIPYHEEPYGGDESASAPESGAGDEA